MSTHQTPGERTASRLAARGDALRRQETPDGGEVYTGPLARAALRALGARAMTMDETIIVDEGFDLSNPEDQALYAHERFHQTESGGEGAEGERDSEEIAARAIERMVLHRSKQGEEFGEIMRDVNDKSSEMVTNQEAQVASSPTEPTGTEAEAALAALLKSGKTADMVAEELARYVIDNLTQNSDVSRFRNAGQRSY